MTLADIKTLLEHLTGFSGKVTYYAFPEKHAPALPFICFRETGTDNFGADNIVYHEILRVDIELYAKQRDLASEALIETALNNSGIFWSRAIEYLDSEKCYMTTYSIEV